MTTGMSPPRGHRFVTASAVHQGMQELEVLGVSVDGDTQQWMVYFMENPIKRDDLGVPLS